MTSRRLDEFPVHLDREGSAQAEPRFTGDMAWYQSYSARHQSDGAEARLMSWHHFATSWDVWEMHPDGHEVVVCLAGEITLVQEGEDGTEIRISLCQGEYAINEPGVWHTADVVHAATCLFVTAGHNTQHRPR